MEELKNNSVVEEDTEGTVVVITDEEGNEYNYVEEMVFDAGSDKYAILVSIDGDEECECHEHDEECGCEEEVDVILAKIVKDENGEVEYIEPTDEEFEKTVGEYLAFEFSMIMQNRGYLFDRIII